MHKEAKHTDLERIRLATQWAPRTCWKDPMSGENCAWYHGFWPILRALNLVTTPNSHREFLTEAFASAAHSGARRVLISGAVDDGMLKQVLDGFAAANVTPQVTVLDRCPTPLFLSRAYAASESVAITTIAQDILEFAPKHKFDLITTHSFLGHFSIAQRGELVRRWRSALQPSGIVVTVNRIRPNAKDCLVGFAPEEAQRFLDTVEREARDISSNCDWATNVLIEAARVYVEKSVAWPVKSLEEVGWLLKDSGFAIEQLAIREWEATHTAALAGPTAPKGAAYACIVARAL